MVDGGRGKIDRGGSEIRIAYRDRASPRRREHRDGRELRKTAWTEDTALRSAAGGIPFPVVRAGTGGLGRGGWGCRLAGAARRHAAHGGPCLPRRDPPGDRDQEKKEREKRGRDDMERGTGAHGRMHGDVPVRCQDTARGDNPPTVTFIR